MSMIFNQDVFQEFFEKAITKMEDFVPGQTYYTNFYPNKFVFQKFITNNESYARSGLIYKNNDDANDLDWMLYTYHVEAWSKYPAQDREDVLALITNNIGSHYSPPNPWMVFADEETAKECREKMPVSIISDSFYDDYDEDYDY